MEDHNLILKTITEENFFKYGNLFTDYENEKVILEKWPAHPDGFRSIEDGVGGGETKGHFLIGWKDGQLKAKNTAVKHGDYEAYCCLDQEERSIEILEEINYHACGSQMFFCKNKSMILVVAKIEMDDEIRYPDDVHVTDFEAFMVPPGVGVHFRSYIWHCPPIILPEVKSALIMTKQSKVHSKVYYYPRVEDKKRLKVLF